MGTRGRKSRTDLALANASSSSRPAPPPSLGTEQRLCWLAIVNDLPADEFNAAQLPLLEQYVSHRIEARHIAQLIEQATSGSELDINYYDKLLKMQERESRAMASIGVRLGFAMTTAKAQTGGSPSGTRPWE